MKKVDYITFNDVYNGIYQSQVIDVVEYLSVHFDVKIRLIAFVPLRIWKSEKKIIKSKLPSARVYPIPGKLIHWKRCRILLKLISRGKFAITRGPIAFGIAQELYTKVVYDGRAAVKAEVEEYNVTGSKILGDVFIQAELNAVQKSDFRIAVSHQLVKYWKEELHCEINEEKLVVIPCTLSSGMLQASGNKWLNNGDNVRVVYAGGTGAWQSFDRMVELLDQALFRQENLEVIFLTKEHSAIENLRKKYTNRVQRKWLSHNEVGGFLSSCDYGLLIRDRNYTNQVASPVKFAEYLNAGLKVLISEGLGDFTDFTLQNDAGLVIGNELPRLSKVNFDDKAKMHKLSGEYFEKSAGHINQAYSKLIQSIN